MLRWLMMFLGLVMVIVALKSGLLDSALVAPVADYFSDLVKASHV